MIALTKWQKMNMIPRSPPQSCEEPVGRLRKLRQQLIRQTHSRQQVEPVSYCYLNLLEAVNFKVLSPHSGAKLFYNTI